MRHFKGLVTRMALESESEVPGVAEDAAIAGADSAETELVELSEPVAELNEDIAEVEEGNEAAASLESYRDYAASTLATGGMSKETAYAVEMHVEFVSKRVGVSKRFPAMESFGGATSRVKATNVAMEEIKEKLKEIWTAIVEALKKAAQWVVDNFNKYFGSAEKLQKRAEAIAEKAKSLSGTAEKKTIESAALFKALQIGNRVNNVSASIADVGAAVTSTYERVSGTYIDVAKKIVTALDTEKADLSGITFAATGNGNAGDAYGTAPEGLSFNRSDELPGGMAVVEVGPKEAKSGLAAVEAYARAEVSVRPFNPKATAKGEQLPVLTGQDVIKITDGVEKIAAAVIGGREIEKELGTELKAVVAAADKHSKNVESGEDADAKKAARALQRAVGNMAKLLVGGPVAVTSYATRTGSAALNYCEKSLAQYK